MQRESQPVRVREKEKGKTKEEKYERANKDVELIKNKHLIYPNFMKIESSQIESKIKLI